DLRTRGLALRPHEAVAIVQALIYGPEASTAARSPYGPPTPETVEVTDEGSVVCTCSAATPAVSEIAILLQALLPSDPRIPGGLRSATSRALLEVGAPPFDSIAECSRPLARFERGDRAEVVRGLFDRLPNDGTPGRAGASIVGPASAAGSSIESPPSSDRPLR